MAPINGKMYRSLINDKEISHERSVSYEPEEIVIIIYDDISAYYYWLGQKRERINFKMTNTNIDEERIISHVILAARMEDVAEIILKLWTPERVKESEAFMGR